MPLRVLIADDDPSFRLVLQKRVQSLGHNVVLVEDGAQAIEQVREQPFDVILCDWMMPYQSGIDVCTAVRGMQDRPYTFFILLTALDGNEHLLQAMEVGADDFLIKPVNKDHLAARMIVAERVVALHRDLDGERKKLQQALKDLHATSRIDSLTGTFNRRALDENLNRMQAEVDRYDRRFALALCDLDCFKAYNDTYGHVEGDAALCEVGRTLQDGVRSGDSVFRYGGEEFLIVFPEQDLESATLAMERLRINVLAKRRVHALGPAEFVSLSAGVALLQPSHERSLQSSLEAADSALYVAKNAGRNRVCKEQPTCAETAKFSAASSSTASPGAAESRGNARA